VKTFSTKSTLTTFLYQLMRDHVTPGVIEGLVLQDEKANAEGHDTFVLTNGYLAEYAAEVADRLTK
jgi:hypothetical protein